MDVNSGVILTKSEYQALLEASATLDIIKRILLAQDCMRFTGAELKAVLRSILKDVDDSTEKVEVEVIEEKKEVDLI